MSALHVARVSHQYLCIVGQRHVPVVDLEIVVRLQQIPRVVHRRYLQEQVRLVSVKAERSPIT